MPDTLSRYRWRHEDCDPTACVATDEQGCETTQLLAHIAALTAAVEGLTLYDENARTMADAAESMKRRVLAILRGALPGSDWTDPKG